ncbi:centromere protein S isoform X2 [Mixophyes fleayi]|uniref:centromere protein S isoform X2 n=1 Tax=Mixophyes fleayi TaxID=3061075 RepID=UPI003F4E25CA
MAEEDEGQFNDTQRLKAAVHYTVGGLCQEVADDKEVTFSQQAIAAISEITFRQCESFAKDLELFARHAKRTTINMDDVKLVSRRSRSLHAHITACSEEIASSNQGQKEKRKKKSVGAGKGQRRSEGDSAVPDSEEQNME